MKKQMWIVFLILLISVSSATLGLAQGKYPTKAIDIIVPYSPGGGTDIMFRNIEKIITQYKLVPQPINIVNKGGRRSDRESLLPFPARGRLYLHLLRPGNRLPADRREGQVGLPERFYLHRPPGERY